MPTFHITSLDSGDEPSIQQAAELLVAGFKEHWPDAYPGLNSALAEVRESFGKDRLSRVAHDEAGRVLGWIGGIRQYDGHVWELHPLIVHPGYQGQGIGRALVQDLETQVRARGGLTIMLGTDDEDYMTSLSGVDLYPDVCAHIAAIRNLKRHPYQFYQRLGYAIIGVVPDANGRGKPDILMAKKVISDQ